jgi:hypothetical protein
MTSALDVDVEQSRADYRVFHESWNERVNREGSLLQELGADMVLSNVGYLPLAGAQSAGIPNAALCSLNWADIYRHYCGEDGVAAQIESCYARADVFFRVTPGMAMDELHNLVHVAPIAAVGRDRRIELHSHLGLPGKERLVLVSMGGIAGRLPIENWPRIEGVRWLVQQGWQVGHPDAITFESLPLSFSELLASCDALLCKPGYGSFVEATCSGTPVIFVGRPDWPETPALVEWLKQNGVCREVSREELETGHIASDLSYVWNTAKPGPVRANGAAQIVEWLTGKLKA